VQFLSSLGVVVEKELFRLFQGWSGGGERTIPLIPGLEWWWGKLFRLSVQFLSSLGVVVGKTIPLIGIVSFHR
ncbi:hypothetical protein, partial [Phormidium sp. CCY1219]|uniref:hypothetical protein n=1 Tax=Phormidium sp. CCY1219 TaxID=2886104 RepID=UPI002D1EB70D